jgi:hypothetical protein
MIFNLILGPIEMDAIGSATMPSYCSWWSGGHESDARRLTTVPIRSQGNAWGGASRLIPDSCHSPVLHSQVHFQVLEVRGRACSILS